MEGQIELEKLRAVNTGLATNPATAADFIKSLLNEQEEVAETDEEWTTPRSVEEIEQFLRQNAI